MSNGPKTITQLPAATAYAASDLIPIVQNVSSSNTTRSITPAVLLAPYANLSSPTFSNTVAISNTLTVSNSVSTNNFIAANTLTAGNSSVNAVIGYTTFQSYGAIAAFAGNQNNYVEMYLYNANSQSNASADMIVFDNNGPLGYNFVDMGIVSSTWASSGWTISNPSDAYLYSANTNLSIGVQAYGGGSNYINFFTGGTLASNERMKIDAGGNVNIGNTTGTTSLSIGNTQSNVTINSTSQKFGNVASATGGALVNTSTFTVGNSSVNTFTNSTHFYSGNTVSYGFGNSVAEALYTSNAYGVTGAISQTLLTAANVSVGNSGAQTFINSISISTTTYYGNAASGPAYAQSLGYMGLPQNVQSSNYFVALSDYGGHILSQTAAAGTQTITLSNNQNAAIPIGGAVSIILQGTGSLKIAADTGVTMYLAGSATPTTPRNLASYGMATALKIGTNIWMLNGTGLT